jgi:hypothetical protein
MVEGKRALGRACMECDAIHDQVSFFRGDYLSRLRTFIAGRWCSLEFDQVLSGRQFILPMQEANLEHREERLTMDQARASNLLSGGTCRQSWENSGSAWSGLEPIEPLRESNCHG